MGKFNFEAKDTYWYLDEYNMVMYKHPDYMHEFVTRDAIGRNYEAYMAYRDIRFLYGIRACWKRVYRGKRYYYQGIRHPEGHPVGMSRDHVMNTVYTYHEAGQDVNEFISHLRWKISNFASFTVSLWLYLKLLQGKKWAKIYYPLMFLEMSFWKKWNKFIYKITGVGALGEEEHQLVFKPALYRWPKVLTFISDILFPTYTLRHRAIQWSLLPQSKWRDRLQKVSWELVPKYNYALKILLNHPDKVAKEQVESYKSMSGDRWSDILNPWLNYGRDIRILPEPMVVENQLDKDYLIALFDTNFYKQQNEKT